MHTTCPHCRRRFANPTEALAHCLDHYLADPETTSSDPEAPGR